MAGKAVGLSSGPVLGFSRLKDNEAAVCARFGEIFTLREFITPDAFAVKELYQRLKGSTEEETILACWNWVVENIRYPKSDRRVMYYGGKEYVAEDWWGLPAETISTGSEDCDGRAFLLVSLLRNFLPEDKVFAVLGNLAKDGASGHAWVTVSRGNWHILETTLSSLPDNPWKLDGVENIYRPALYFNDKEVFASVKEKLCLPLGPCKVDFLKDYWCGCREEEE